MKAVFIDASATLGDVAERLHRADDIALVVNRQVDITPEQIPAVMGDAEILIVDHTAVPTSIAKQCKGLKHVVFLGTGARSYMNPEELAEIGIEVHIIKGYGDTAVAECAFALMWAFA
jgi:D-3-phosphoglycerate dehydrogenase